MRAAAVTEIPSQNAVPCLATLADHCFNNTGVMSLVHSNHGESIYADLWSCDISAADCGFPVQPCLPTVCSTHY